MSVRAMSEGFSFPLEKAKGVQECVTLFVLPTISQLLPKEGRLVDGST